MVISYWFSTYPTMMKSINGRMKLRAARHDSLTLSIFVSFAAIFFAGSLGSYSSASATIPGPVIAGTGSGPLSINDGAPISVSISFTATSQHNDNKYNTGSFVMTDSSGATIGTGSITAGHVKNKGYDFSGTLGANGVLGVNNGAGFTI